MSFPPKIINYFYKLSYRQYAKIKNFDSELFPIQSGVDQGLSSSGDLFCLAILPIFMSIEKAQIIRPYQLSFKTLNPNADENLFHFPKCLGFADDLLINTHVGITNDQNCPQLTFILDLFKTFENWSGLALNPLKYGIFSAVPNNSLIDNLCKKYSFLNLSNENLSYLGHKFCPKSINSNEISLTHVLEKMS